ncbi:hypothetical protein PIB30_076743 [Stylosanthes scabra]|uniref:Uncharacterized protein n=1 Tax=Stylosanthes scabra TaxID=79078 RepID=A0ABU6QR07_9FABA|nr:hypothetical protein [Stylosanthes scabra]
MDQRGRNGGDPIKFVSPGHRSETPYSAEISARGPGDSRIVPVTAGTLGSRGLNHELQATPAPM